MQERDLYQATWIRSKELGEKEGPIYCERKCWLGRGCYFWDTRIEDARWWGVINYKNKYTIFHSKYDKSSSEYWDIAGDVEDNNECIECCKSIIEQNDKRKIKTGTIGQLIEIIKQVNSNFHYKAIRAFPLSVEKLKKYQNITFFFDDENKYGCTYLQKVQVCVIDKSFLLDNKYEFVEMHVSNKENN